MEPIVGSISDSPFLAAEHLALLTSRFVSIPSVNGEHPERDLALVIAGLLDDAGLDTHLVGDERRPSLAAVRGSGDSGVLLNGHLDTVPVDDAEHWTHDPFAGAISGGAVHGRGACDMKGGLAVEVAVAQWAGSQPGDHRLVLQFAMGEERGEPGTEDLIAAGWVAPEGIVLEPTDLLIGVAQRGLVTLRIQIEGRAGHASRPDLADNPIDAIGEVVAVVSRLGSRTRKQHPILGAPAWTVTGIHAGVIPSMIPGEAEVLIDRRMVPGETVERVESELRRALHEGVPGTTARVTVVKEEGIYEPAEIASDGATVTRLADAIGLFGGEAEIFGTPYSSDVRHLINHAGVTALTFGPGRFDDMHARDEMVRVDDLQAAARSVASFCALTWKSEDG